MRQHRDHRGQGIWIDEAKQLLLSEYKCLPVDDCQESKHIQVYTPSQADLAGCLSAYRQLSRIILISVSESRSNSHSIIHVPGIYDWVSSVPGKHYCWCHSIWKYFSNPTTIDFLDELGQPEAIREKSHKIPAEREGWGASRVQCSIRRQ